MQTCAPNDSTWQAFKQKRGRNGLCLGAEIRTPRRGEYDSQAYRRTFCRFSCEARLLRANVRNGARPVRQVSVHLNVQATCPLLVIRKLEPHGNKSGKPFERATRCGRRSGGHQGARHVRHRAGPAETAFTLNRGVGHPQMAIRGGR